MQLRDAEPARVEHHHHRRVRNVDADLDHGRCDEHVDLTRSERLEDRRLLRRGEASVQQREPQPFELAGLQALEGLGRGGHLELLRLVDERAHDVRLMT